MLLLPVVVAAGLAVGRLGLDGHVSGLRVAADLALSWALVAAALAVRERPRWRRSGWLLATASFAVLGADLVWAASNALWTLGFLLEGLWAALLVHLVLAFPDGRPWSRLARIAISGAYVATLGGQLVGAFVDPNTRDVLGLAPHETIAHTVDRTQEITAIVVGLVVLALVVRRLRVLGGPARRAQGPLLVAAALTASSAVICLGWVIATDSVSSALETIVRAVAVSMPLGIVAGIVWSRLRRPELSELVVELPTEAGGMRERLARALGDPTLEVAYRLADGRSVDATGRPVSLPDGTDRTVTAVTAGGEEIAALVHDPALLDEPALVESVRATAGLVLENERLAAEVRSQLAEVRASRGRIVTAADAERRRIERDLHDGAQQRLVTLSRRAWPRSSSRRPGRSGRPLARTGRRRGGARRAPRAGTGNPPGAAQGRGSRGGRGGARTTSTAAGDGAGHGGRTSVGSDRARRLLRRLGSAHECRETRLGNRGIGATRTGTQRRFRLRWWTTGSAVPASRLARAWLDSATDSRRSTRR